jgi:opacity protein-like surface antigen
MKKILLTAILATAPLMGYAAETTASSTGDALTGLLLGVEGAFQRTDYDQKLGGIDGAGDSFSEKLKNPSYQLAGAVSLGYFTRKDDLYYGAKVSVGKTFGSRDKKKASAGDNQYENIVTKVSQAYNLALVGHFGTYVSDNQVVYGLLGVKRIRYDFDVSGTNAGFGRPVKGYVRKTVFGPVLGFGMKQAFSEQWAFSTEVSYERYSKVTTGNVDTAAGTLVGTSIKPQVWNVTVGLSHKF